MEKLLSASDIAMLRLPELPTSKAAILAMARRENWYCEEATGLGGKRLVFELPTAHIRADVPIGARYSAGEIATMRLPGLPSTRAGVEHVAQQEKWPYEEVAGIAGNRKLYTIPDRYFPAGFVLPEGGMPAPRPMPPSVEEKSATPPSIAAGTKADPELLALAVQAVEEWCQESGKTLTPGRKGSVAAVLYDYLARGAAAEDVRQFLKAVG